MIYPFNGFGPLANFPPPPTPPPPPTYPLRLLLPPQFRSDTLEAKLGMPCEKKI